MAVIGFSMSSVSAYSTSESTDKTELNKIYIDVDWNNFDAVDTLFSKGKIPSDIVQKIELTDGSVFESGANRRDKNGNLKTSKTGYLMKKVSDNSWFYRYQVSVGGEVFVHDYIWNLKISNTGLGGTVNAKLGDRIWFNKYDQTSNFATFLADNSTYKSEYNFYSCKAMSTSKLFKHDDSNPDLGWEYFDATTQGNEIVYFDHDGSFAYTINVS
jgi:hypothetical protein